MISALLATLLATPDAGAPVTFLERKVPLSRPPLEVVSARLDDDAFPDVAVVTESGGPPGFVEHELHILLGSGEGRFVEVDSHLLHLGFGGNGTPIRAIDVTDDGLKDLVLANTPPCRFSVWPSDGSGIFDTAFSGVSFGGYIDDVAFTELTADSYPEVILLIEDFGWYLDIGVNQQDGTFDFIGFSGGPINGLGTNLELVDLNDDGWDEAIAANQTGLAFRMGNASGWGSPNDPLPPKLLTMGCREIESGDFDENGTTDLAVTNPLEQRVRVLLNNGDATFGTPVELVTRRQPESVVVADLNDDGHLDLAAANVGSANVSVFYGDGTGAFAEGQLVKVGRRPLSIAADDIDRDGDVDLVVANGQSENLSVLVNQLVPSPRWGLVNPTPAPPPVK